MKPKGDCCLTLTSEVDDCKLGVLAASGHEAQQLVLLVDSAADLCSRTGEETV